MFATYFKYKGFQVQKKWGCGRNEYYYTVARTNQTFYSLKEVKQHINNEINNTKGA
jgi:hypothetical protein